ncbi:MAG TPA: hypothetical protein VMV86_03205 [Methanosarcinales archaeon]|nr:hypothetical protein [Methanosarcinales archaeon]
MAAITGAITAVVGIGVSVATAIDKAEKEKKAAKAANIAANKAAQLKETNALASLQAPDIQGLADERNAQSQAQTIEALQGMGSEGAAQVTKLEMNAREAAAQTAADQGKVNYDRDLAVANEQSAVDMRNMTAERSALTDQANTAKAQEAAARQGKQEATLGAVQGLGNLAEGIGSATSLESQAGRAKSKQDLDYINKGWVKNTKTGKWENPLEPYNDQMTAIGNAFN